MSARSDNSPGSAVQPEEFPTIPNIGDLRAWVLSWADMVEAEELATIRVFFFRLGPGAYFLTSLNNDIGHLKFTLLLDCLIL